MEIKQLHSELNEISGKAQFASVTYASKSTGEVARHTLIIGARYENVLRDSILALSLVTGDELATIASEQGAALIEAEKAKEELAASLAESLQKHLVGEQNKDYTKQGVYARIGNGMTVSLNDGSFELHGLSHSKKVLTEGVHKLVKSSGKTKCKNALRKLLPLGKYRTLALDAGAVQTVRLNGETIEFE